MKYKSSRKGEFRGSPDGQPPAGGCLARNYVALKVADRHRQVVRKSPDAREHCAAIMDEVTDGGRRRLDCNVPPEYLF
ncbi:MAG: hypothetical protein ABIG30_02565 [Candidatus Aenigmatarchaeota archaeon]